MTWLTQKYLAFRSKVRLHFFDALLKRARQRMERRRLREVLPAPIHDARDSVGYFKRRIS